MDPAFQNKKLLIVYQPWRELQSGLSYPMRLSLEKSGLDTDLLDITFPPRFENKNIADKLINIFRRVVLKDTSHYLKAEKKHYNRYYLKKLKQLDTQNYDFILVIQPFEFSPFFLRKLKNYGKNISGYVWDGFRDRWIKDIKQADKHLDYLYCFDPADI